MQGKTGDYLDKWVHGVSSHQEMLDNLVGSEKLERLREAETVREGYYE